MNPAPLRNRDVELSEVLSTLLGKSCNVSTEYGVAVYDLETMQELFRAPKIPKTLTAEWLQSQVEKRDAGLAVRKQRRDKCLASLRNYVKASGATSSDFSAYPTTFGFSVCNLFGSGLEDAKQIVSSLGIPFRRMEYSDASLVLRVIL